MNKSVKRVIVDKQKPVPWKGKDHERWASERLFRDRRTGRSFIPDPDSVAKEPFLVPKPTPEAHRIQTSAAAVETALELRHILAHTIMITWTYTDQKSWSGLGTLLTA